MARWSATSHEDDFFGTDSNDLEQSSAVNVSAGAPTDRPMGGCSLAVHEAASLEERHRILGYHETYEEAKETTLQDGFIEGYSQTFPMALNLGKLLGKAAITQQLLEQKRSASTPDDAIIDSHQPDEATYRAAAARIRTVLQSINSAEDSSANEEKRIDSSRAMLHDIQQLEIQVEQMLQDRSGS
jgi:hypothetical protein